jgi:hypothetical protein
MAGWFESVSLSLWGSEARVRRKGMKKINKAIKRLEDIKRYRLFQTSTHQIQYIEKQYVAMYLTT